VPARGGAVRQHGLVITGTGSGQVVGRALRVVAVGSGVAVGLDGWVTSFSLRSAGRPQLELVVGFLVLAVAAALAVPGVRWVAAFAGVVATTAAFSAATSADWVAHHLRQHGVPAYLVASPNRLLLTAAAVVVLWALSAVLLRYSDGLLPGPAIRSVRRGAVRAVAVGAATWLGATLAFATLTVVGYFHGNPDRIPGGVFHSYVKTLLVGLVVWTLVVTVVSRPAGLRARDVAFVGSAGLVGYPLYLLLLSLLQGRPLVPDLWLVVNVIAFAAGLAVGLWATRPTQPNPLTEPVSPVG
jgi:hypothetical protein